MSESDGEESAPERGDASGAMKREAEPLRPARPGIEDKPEYLPKFPWRTVLVGGAILGALIGAYWWQTKQEADGLRHQILSVHDEQLRPMSERYVAFREKIERWTIDAASQDPPTRTVDPRLRIASLHAGQGLYLRLGAEDARSPERIATGARAMVSDAITRCLGIAPMSARGLYEAGGFLEPSWSAEARSTSDVMRLRVIDDELARRMERDLPTVATAMQSQYFLLVLQRGENRRDAPVDVFLWDLRRDTLLLATRTRAAGLLIPVRVQLGGAQAPSGPTPNLRTGGANDCSIASQIKALTGEPATTFGASIPEADAGVDAGTDPVVTPAPVDGVPAEPAPP